MRDWTRNDPELDAEDAQDTRDSMIGHCADCGTRIYKGDCYIEIDGILLCDDSDCISNYIRNNYLKES